MNGYSDSSCCLYLLKLKNKLCPKERRYNSTKLHGVTSQKTVNFLVRLRGQKNLTHFVYFPWPLLETRLDFKSSFLLYTLLMTGWSPEEISQRHGLVNTICGAYNMKVKYPLFVIHFTASTCEFFASVQPVNTTRAEAGGRVVSGVGFKLFHCCSRRFESRSGHGYSSNVFVV
jgi:hypothetical protein